MISIQHNSNEVNGYITLEGSKSISNRVLIIHALSNYSFEITNLSNSDDTQTLKQLLRSNDTILDCHHAGTTYRFLTSYLSIQLGTQILTGSERMKQRPIGPLVDALRSIGANIEYLGQEGFPPLAIKEFDYRKYNKTVEVNAGISSQFISSLLLIAPVLPNGLVINLLGDLVSRPYVLMTLKILENYGVKSRLKKKSIVIPNQKFRSKDFMVEADWSSASYLYSILSMASAGQIAIRGLSSSSLQGDSIIQSLMIPFGIKTSFLEDELLLQKDPKEQISFDYDFISCPDLAQTMAVVCAGHNVFGTFYGLKTLKIKETDRISALNNELKKIGYQFERVEKTENDEKYKVLKYKTDKELKIPRFDTYKDHRMAMAFASWALRQKIEINDPNVITKSYPNYWSDLEKLGFIIE